MTLHRTTTTKRLLALLASVCMVVVMGACSSNGGAQSQSKPMQPSNTTNPAGNVVIFTPADGITISQQTPLNKWEKLIPEIVSSLKKEGVKGDDITVKTASNLDKQSQSVQDYVVNHINDSTPSSPKSKTTLIVAPVADMPESDRQYGDYAEHNITWDSDASDENAQDHAQSAQRLVSALQLAQHEGMKVILVSNTLQGYTPDVYAPMVTAEQIGKLQARELVNKLDLDKVTANSPKRIEVLLPYDTTDDHGGEENTAFTQSVFKGIWKMLGPYFKDGKAVSPSGTLDASSTASDWKSVAFESAKAEQIKSTLAERLGMDKNDSHPTRIDGIISSNDYVAKNVADNLTKLGYSGSSNDINPSISISGIVDSITGKKDLERRVVPEPANASSHDDGGYKDSDEEKDANWPIITGYGAYISSMPNIVNGKQWMTAMENRNALAHDIARTCVSLNVAGKPSKLDFITSTTVDGKKTPTIHEDILAISADNLKKTLIEPGYISLADAGL